MKTIWAALFLAGVLETSARAETVTYLHTDLLGSVVLETDQNRNVVARYEYEPYGLPRQAIADAPGYTGHVHDAGSGLVYMQQRYYDPEVGQFLSVDPMPSDTATGWNFNRYNYAANNPYTFVDPDGRMVGKPWEEPWGGRDPWGDPPDDPMGGPCKTGKACWGDDGAGHEPQKNPFLRMWEGFNLTFGGIESDIHVQGIRDDVVAVGQSVAESVDAAKNASAVVGACGAMGGGACVEAAIGFQGFDVFIGKGVGWGCRSYAGISYDPIRHAGFTHRTTGGYGYYAGSVIISEAGHSVSGAVMVNPSPGFFGKISGYTVNVITWGTD
jgi:RHS repeat-associated protein